jgi:protein transport protein SEC31
MATLCTYASAEEFPDLCEALGDRLEEELGHNESNVSLRQDASFCYIAGSKLEKVVGVWIAELQDKEQNGLKQDSTDSSFSVHARSLQAFIEKVSVFREVTHYQDRDRSATSNWKLAPLYEKYTEYADILAAHGQLQVAEKYLDLLPEKYPAADVARNRVKQATKKAAVPLAARQQASTLPVHRTQPGIPSFEDQRAPAFSASSGFPAPAPFASQAPAQSQYAPQAPNPYSAVGYQPQQPMQPPGRTQFGIPQPPPFGVAPQPQSLGPPPRNINTSPSIPPPSKDKNMVNWNDTPEDFFKGPSPRKGTPAAQPTVITPFPNAVAPTPPMAGQPFQPPRAQQQAPPPPRNIVPPPRTMTPQMHQVMQAQAQTIERPSSSAANAYAPQYPNSQLGAMQPQAPIARGNSPYNVPPPVASMPPGPPPTGSRYAPAPVQQQAAPPAQRVPPPPNPYVGRQSFSGAQDMQAGGPPPGMGQNMNQGPPPTARPTPPPARPSKPATPKFRKC